MARAFIGNSRPPGRDGDALVASWYVDFYGSDVPDNDKLPGGSNRFEFTIRIEPGDNANQVNSKQGDAIAALATSLGLTIAKADIFGYDLLKGK